MCVCVCVWGPVFLKTTCTFSWWSLNSVSQLASGTLAKPDSHTFGIVWIVFQISSVVYLPWACNLREGSCFALVSDKPLMCKKRVTICSWNIRSLLKISGDIRISQRNSPPSSSIVDKKLDLLVGELERYGISVAGVQETKCMVWL